MPRRDWEDAQALLALMKHIAMLRRELRRIYETTSDPQSRADAQLALREQIVVPD